MSWEEYSRELLLLRIWKYLGEENYHLDGVEKMFLDAWDGSEYHCLAHVFSVASTALELAYKSGLPETNMHAAVIAGLFHDMGRRPIDDKRNIEAAKWLADKHIDKEMVFINAKEKSYFKWLVDTGIEGTLYPPTEPIDTLFGRILRDADFASLIMPEDVYEEACSALEKETGNRASYDFITSQGALLPVTVEYYRERGLDIELVTL